MRCVTCSHPETKVVETRETADSTRRRRECLDCKARFTTYERSEPQELIVLKKNGSKQAFDQEKLLGGVKRACEKRPVTTEQIDELVAQVEAKARESGKEISSQAIGEWVMERLAKLDEVAYIRFASVYREFADTESFADEINQLRKKKQGKEGIVICRL